MALTYTPSVSGFTPLPAPAAGTRIAYVDPINGNDSTGAVVNASDIVNVYDPTSEENPTPFRNINVAYAALRDGEPDFVLMKRGGVWDYQTGAQLFSFNRFGLNDDNRIFWGWYGSLNDPRPRIDFTNITSGTAFVKSTGHFRNITIRGIHFRCNNTAVPFPSGVPNAIDAVPNSSQPENVTIEDCFFERSEIQLQNTFASGETGRYQNLVVRRNVFTDSYGAAALVVNYDDVIWEENIGIDIGIRFSEQNSTGLDAQGWYLQDIDANPSGDGAVVRGNVLTTFASSGIQLRSGGVCEFNYAHKVPHGFTETPRPETHDVNGDFISFVGNLVTDGMDEPGIRAAPNQSGWGVESRKTATGSRIADNIFSSNNGTLPYGINVASGGFVTIERNTIYNWGGAALQIADVDDVTIRNNTFYSQSSQTPNVSRGLVHLRYGSGYDPADYTMENNIYFYPGEQSGWFTNWNGGSAIADFEAFATLTGETGLVAVADPWAGSESPNLAGFLADSALPSVSNEAQWKTALAAQREGNWRDDIMPVSIINWFREGFGLAAVSDETVMANATPQWQAIPRTTIAEEDSTTINLTSYVSDSNGDNLTFAVVGTWPDWVTLDGSVVTIAPTAGEANATPFEMTVRATDDGDPIRFAETTFLVTVTEPAGGEAPSGEANVPQYDMAIVSFVFFNGGKG